jgi:hypothetical protein
LSTAIESGELDSSESFWPRAPLHKLNEHGPFFVAAGTYKKEHHFAGTTRLGVLQRGRFKLAAEFGWSIEA